MGAGETEYMSQHGRERTLPYFLWLDTYLFGDWLANAVLSTEAVRAGPEGPAVVLAAETSGNCSRKLARSSSPGFCELVLQGNVSVTRRARWSAAPREETPLRRILGKGRPPGPRAPGGCSGALGTRTEIHLWRNI